MATKEGPQELGGKWQRSLETSESLGPQEIVERTNTVLVNYAEKAVGVLNNMVRKGEGKESLGFVWDRPEDEQLQIDSPGEHILTNLIRQNRIPAFVYGEHNDYSLSNSDKPKIVFVIDSFDNTSQYKRGLDTSPYTVAAAYTPDGEPIGCVIGDIKDQKVYASINGQNIIKDLVTGETKPVKKSKRKTIKDDDITIATYLGSNEYSLKFFELFGGLVKNMPPKGVLYGGGGSYIYGLLASGAVDAYIMFDEPRSEIDPGLPIALVAGCEIVSVNEDGSFEPYRFDSKRTHEEVPLFIASTTPELGDEIIRYSQEAKQKTANRETLITEM